MTIKIIPNESGQPSGKLADAELIFTDAMLAGLKLIGFSVWQTRTGARNVTVPARQYSVNGERRAFALLRPVEDQKAIDAIRAAIIEAYAAYEADAARAVTASEPIERVLAEGWL